MSLASLKERLNQISKKHADDTFTFDISEPKKWMKGNAPEDWLEYIQHVKDKVQFRSDMSKHQILSDLFEKAFQDINSGDHKNNEAYAHLFVSYARLKSDCVPEDAMMIFNQARAIVRRFAIVHVASAQFELERDNVGKAKKILEKALLFEARPAEDIELALKKLKEGQSRIFVSPVFKKFDDTDKSRRKFPSGSDTSEELKSTSPLGDILSANTSISIPSKPQQEKKPEPDVAPKVSTSILRMATTALPTRVTAPTVDSSVHKAGLKSFRSTPLLNSERKRNLDLGLPARVKKINLPFEVMQVEEEEEEMNTMDSFKPLETHHASINASHAHTSGYLSMTQASDCTIPMETKTLDKPVGKMEVEVERPVVSVQTNIPKPAITTPEVSVPQTPNNKDIPSTPLPNLKIITVNGQQYGVIGVMGTGGSSKVYQVLDGNHKIKAIKCVNLDNANDIIVEGYKNEIKLLKRLQYCDKVIKMYDSEFCVNENKLYVVMESGSEDLASFFRSRTKDRKPLSDNLIRFYWEIMLEAVQALHKEGIIHSDLKPANFLLVGGNLKLIDFGIAKALQQDKTSVILETQIGTLNYMSPEAIMDCCGDTSGGQGKPKFKIGVKSDVWSLGCILYNMVYGRTPFQHLKRDFFKLQAIINPDFPIEFPEIGNTHLLDVLKRCLCRDPKSRPSIDELLVHLYLRADKEVKEEVVNPTREKLNNKKMEALISTLADQYSLSPGGIRNLIHQTIETDQTADADAKEKAENRLQGSAANASRHSMKPPAKPHSLLHRPEGSVTVKHIRTPLSSLSLQDLKVAGAAGVKDPGLKQRDSSGT